jgi:ABC-type Co2+ transport system permease subunit
MHIEDGILSAGACAGWYAATGAFVVPGIYEIKKRVR